MPLKGLLRIAGFAAAAIITTLLCGFGLHNANARNGEDLWLHIGGQNRHAILYVPPSAIGDGPRPLVLVLHGRHASAGLVRKTFGFDPLAARDGAIVAYPDGLDSGWNDGRPDATNADSRGAASTQDEIAFLLALIDRIETEYAIDRRRVFIAGHSNGGFMANRFAAEHPERVAAVASVSGTLGAADIAHLPHAGVVSSLHIWGGSDHIVPAVGGPVSVGRGTALSANALSAWWAGDDGCVGPETLATLPGLVVRRYRSCRPGVVVENIGLSLQGHAWPRRSAPTLQFIATTATATATPPPLDATALIWAFFMAHPKPRL